MAPIRRWLLLFAPARSFAWLLHFGFYFVIWVSILNIVNFKAASQLFSEKLAINGICFAIVVAALLRYWALMEMRWAEGFKPSPSSFCRRLLWYSPASRRELIARAALLLTVVQGSAFILLSWASRLEKALTLVEWAATVVVLYAWSVAELRLHNDSIQAGFPHN
jgi:hypothetical protein